MSEQIYREEDRIFAEKKVRQAKILLAICLAVPLAFFVTALCVRWEKVCIISGGAMFFVGYFVGDMRLRPAWRFRRFLREIATGLSTQRTFVLNHAETQPRHEDGVQVLELQVALDDPKAADSKLGADRILYMRADRMPDWVKEGGAYSCACYGRHILSITEEETAGERNAE